MSKKMGLILAALGLSTGLAFAQQSGDYRRSPAASEMTPAPPLAAPETAPMSGKTSEPSLAPSETAPASEATGTIAEQNANQIRAKELIGVKVVNQDQKVGKVDDLLFDKNGKVAGVVLTVGGVFGIGDKLVAVPWQQIKVSAGDEPTLRIAMSKEQLEAAPYFEPAKADSKASGMKSETQQR